VSGLTLRALKQSVRPQRLSGAYVRPFNFTVRWHMGDLTPFERRVLDAFLLGSEPQLEILGVQAAVATVSSREHTGCGAYINFQIPESVPAVFSPPSIILGDVHVQVADVPHGVASLLFISSGRLDFLEFATYTGSWPKDPQLLQLGYYRFEPSSPKGFTLVPVDQRDSVTLARALAGASAPCAT
jgi:hypothetical protein